MGVFDFIKRKELAEITTLRKGIEDRDKEIELLQERISALSKYEGIADAEAEIARQKSEAEAQIADMQRELNEILDNAKVEFEEVQSKRKEQIDNLTQQVEALSAQYSSGLATFKELEKAIALYTENLDLADFGVYEPHFDFDTPGSYKDAITEIRERQKELIPEGAVKGGEGISWNGSLSQGQVMVRGIKKVMLRAFNGECDSFVANVDWNNVTKMEERIRKSREVINKGYQRQGIYISEHYMDLKIKELRLAFEYKLKKYEEKEEQRAIREQMREEEKARREIDAALAKADREREMYEKALEKARIEIELVEGKKQERMQAKIAELEARLQEAEDNRERALSMAQQTKRGHIYVISNIGSFGEGVYKIGMTRRLDPLDRIRELGDASVPFPFDVHALIFSEDAPSLEAKLHRVFETKRVNQVNLRKEFFRVSLEEIEEEVRKSNATIEFTKTAEARDFRESKAKILQGGYQEEHHNSVFPEQLFA